MSRPTESIRTSSHGRGGAGNINARPENTGSSAADLQTPTIKSDVFTTGRGGSGNMASTTCSDTRRAAQDVEAPQHHTKEAHGTFHWGRGGDGNMVTVGDGDRPKSRQPSKGAADRAGSFTGMMEKSKELLGLKKKAAARANEVAIE
ncbi:hypothetical protein AMS68_005467 [Peltaster fructicola]|uniref:DUF3602 domain-containing protein n=1 Tax=Peltaster fructicola TaxID=286661 RepID=A0A6H0XZX0_9PEZI|nr:hypothetical protein AMS68_005467 [Peltaster fructicola]